MKKKPTNATINVRGTAVAVILNSDLNSGEFATIRSQAGLKNKDTVLFLGVWEQLNNSEFKTLEFEGIKFEAGQNSFYFSAKKCLEKLGI